MFSRTRPDKEIEGIIGRRGKRRHADRGTKEKRQEKRISRGKTVSPRSMRAARKTLQDDSSKGSAGPQVYVIFGS